jgi:phenylalanyl-tRNA synthetase beta chain
MERILRGLQIPVKAVEAGVEVRAPSFRHDLLEEVDLIEEVARHHGYDRLPEESRAPMVCPGRRSPAERFERTLREAVSNRGFHEVLGSSFMPDDEPGTLALEDGDPRRATLRVLNPVVQGEATLKTTAIGEMARIVDRNRRRGLTGPMRFFQLARCFHARMDEALPAEPRQLVLAWSGPVRPAHFDESARPVDLFDAIGEVEGLLAQLGLELARRQADAGSPWRAGSLVEFHQGDRVYGRIGEIAPAVRRRLDVEAPVYVAEFEFASLAAGVGRSRAWTSFSAYPPVRRDLSLVAACGELGGGGGGRGRHHRRPAREL